MIQIAIFSLIFITSLATRYAHILAEARRVLADARRALAADGTAQASPDGDGDILSLYEQLRASLSGVEESALRELVGRVGRTVQDLQTLAASIERLRSLRGSLDRI